METKFKTSDLMKEIILTVKIVGVKKLKIKMAISIFFIKIAAWILGVGEIKIESEN